MNIPFRFTLHTSTGPYGRFFDYSTASAVKNLTIESLVAIPGSPDGLGTTAATRLDALGLKAYRTYVAGLTPFWVNGFSVTAWFDPTVDVQPMLTLGLYDTVNSAFLPLYPCLSPTVPGGGIQKSLGRDESGLYVPASATLLPAIRAEKMGATDGTVKVAGDLSIYRLPT